MEVMYDYLEHFSELRNYNCTVFKKKYLPFFLEKCKEYGYEVGMEETHGDHVWVYLK